MYAQQVIFIDHEEEKPSVHAGILIDEQFIICAECGSIFDLMEDDIEITDIFDEWTPFEFSNAVT